MQFTGQYSTQSHLMTNKLSDLPVRVQPVGTIWKFMSKHGQRQWNREIPAHRRSIDRSLGWFVFKEVMGLIGHFTGCLIIVIPPRNKTSIHRWISRGGVDCTYVLVVTWWQGRREKFLNMFNNLFFCHLHCIAFRVVNGNVTQWWVGG